MLSIGIVGKPNAGKSTLFNALTNQNVPAEDYPFCTIDKNTGVVPVPDQRMEELSNLLKSEKKVYATVTFVDIAGLVEGASKGEGLGNMFLAHIREVDLIMYLLDGFRDTATPTDDLEVVQTELILKDIETVQKKIDSLKKDIKDPKKKSEIERLLPYLEKLLENLNNSSPAISYFKTISDQIVAEYIKDLFLLTNKDFIVVINTSENTPKEKVEEIKKQIIEKQSQKGVSISIDNILTINAKLEYELSQLTPNERQEYITELNIEYIGLPNVIQKCYSLLGFITFYTGNEKILNAWQIQNGENAKEAAGKIHTDLSTGFIRADIIHYTDFVKAGGWKQSKDMGVVHTVGKEYIMNDGDLMLVYHN